MFGRLLLFNIKRQLRTKELMFWNLCFPILLGTLFFVTFGGSMEKSESFHAVSVAYITEGESDDVFSTLLETLEEGENPLLIVTRTNLEEGKQLLEADEVKGVFEDKDGELQLYVKQEGISQSILKLVLEQYQQRKEAFYQIGSVYPENLSAVISSMETEISMIREEKYTDGSMDATNGYFYALIAMNCLYGCFGGVNCAVDNKANLSALAIRRNIASQSRFLSMAADILTALAEQFLFTMFSVVYLKYILGVHFGSNMLPLMLVVFVGSFIGTATGFFIGSLGGMRQEIKTGISVAVTMVECFLSGLMVGNMYHIIQEICPILNKLNPASLIVDALYSLDIYSDYTRFSQNLGILCVIAALLCIGSYLMVRRERYASI